jgi:hypothetical protein
MPCLEFERTIPAIEAAKTIHALDSVATMIDIVIKSLLVM